MLPHVIHWPFVNSSTNWLGQCNSSIPRACGSRRYLGWHVCWWKLSFAQKSLNIRVRAYVMISQARLYVQHHPPKLFIHLLYINIPTIPISLISRLNSLHARYSCHQSLLTRSSQIYSASNPAVNASYANGPTGVDYSSTSPQMVHWFIMPIITNSTLDIHMLASCTRARGSYFMIRYIHFNAMKRTSRHSYPQATPYAFALSMAV